MSDQDQSGLKRLFVGISAQGLVTPSFRALYKKLKMSADRLGLDFKWTRFEQLHLTLYFLGPTPVEKIPAIEKALGSLGAHRAFSLKMFDAGAYPEIHHARVLWLGVQQSRPLMELASSIQKCMAESGYAPDVKSFSPHITIARTRKARSLKGLLSLLERKSFGTIEVTEVRLFESLLKVGYPEYNTLATFPLMGEGPALNDG